MQAIYGGGSPFIATTTFAQGIGPSDESSDPAFEYHGNGAVVTQRYFDGGYQPYCYSDEDDWLMSEELRFHQDYVLMESMILPNPSISSGGKYVGYDAEATELIKKQLLQKRGVEVAFHADTSRPNQDLLEEGQFLSTRTWAHYTWDDSQPNHAVTIVGWDDDYPKENFVTGHQPDADGAWLVKNSWGSGEECFPNKGAGSWGLMVQKTDDRGRPVFDENGDPVMVHSGYFWISYYDHSLQKPEALVFGYSIATEEVSQYDYMPATDIMVSEYQEPVSMANVFQAEHTQMLNAISCQTADRSTTTKYRVFLLPDDFEDPEDGLMIAEGKVVFEFAGLHKIDLADENIILQKGQMYSVSVALTREDGTDYFNSPRGYNLPGFSTSKVVLGERQSFLSVNGDWTDYKIIADEVIEEGSDVEGLLFFDNFPIKAYGKRLTDDIVAKVNVSRSILSKAEGLDTATATLTFVGSALWSIGDPTVEWGVVEGYEGVVSITPNSSSNQATIRAVDNGRAILYVDVDGYGTAVFDVSVGVAYPAIAIPIAASVEYTGEEQTIDFVVTTKDRVILEKDVQYKVSFSDNIKCGIAVAEITGIGECVNPDDPSPIYAYFAIFPNQAEITSATKENGIIKVAVKDLWPTGISHYDVEYRLQGAADWTKVKMENGTTEVDIGGLGDGTYEVRAQAVLDAMSYVDKATYILPEYAGGYSDIKTV